MSSSSDFKVKKGLQVQGGDLNLGGGSNAGLIQVDAVSGTNTAGENLTISGGEGTGTGAGGSIIFQTADGGNSGANANTLVTALTIADDLTATFTGDTVIDRAATTIAPQADGHALHIDTTTYTDGTTSSGTAGANFKMVTLDRPTLAATNNSITTTTASTLYIANNPAAGTNQTLTNSYALNIAAGGATITGGLLLDKVLMPDDSATAFRIMQGANSYMTFDSSDSAEKVTIAKTLSAKEIQVAAGENIVLGANAASDAGIHIDGNAADFHIKYDHSATGLSIGAGTTAGTTSAIKVDSAGDVTQIGQSTHTDGLYLKLVSGVADWATVSSAAIDTVNNQGDTRLFTSSDTSGTIDAESNLTFASNVLLIGGNSDIEPRLDLQNDENSAQIGIANATNDMIAGSADGDLVINSVGAHNVLIASTDAEVARIATGSAKFTVNSFTITEDTGGSRPALILESTHDDANGPLLTFNKNGPGPASEDTVGTITFDSEDSDNNVTTYGSIVSTIDTVTADSEAGRMELKVAENDATLTTGLLLDGHATSDGVIDVTLGAGAASTVTIPGSLDVNGTLTTIDTTNLSITDALVTVARGNDSLANANGAGIEVECTDGGATNPSLTYQATPAGWESNVHMNLNSGLTYKINDVSILSATTIASSVTTASGLTTTAATTVGTLASGAISSGFGAIDIGTSALTAGSLTIDDIGLNAETINIATSDKNLIVSPGARSSSHTGGTLDVYSGIEVGGKLANHSNADGDGTLLITAHTTMDSDSATAIFTYDSDVYRGGKFLVQASNDTNAELVEVMVVHKDASPDNTNDFFLAIGSVVDTGTQLIDDFTITISSNTATLNLDPTGTFDGTVKVFATLIAED